MVDYVMTPETFSLYTDGRGREVALFGDNHAISAGSTGGRPNTIPVSEYLKRRLGENPNLHVYGEIPPDEEDTVSLFEDSSNKELQKLRDLKDDKSFPHRDRIHNIDNRNTVVTRRVFDDLDRTYNTVRKHLEKRAPELLKKGTDFDETDDRLNEYLEEEDIDSAEEDEIKQDFLNPIVEADMIDTIRKNPHKAQSMIFYVGDKHKAETEKHYLDKKWLPIHKATASEDSAPMEVVKPMEPMPQFEGIPELFPGAKYTNAF